MSRHIGFFAHANCNRYGGKLHPVEVAFADVRTLEVLVATVDNSDKRVGPADDRANKYCSRRIHGLPHNFRGTFSWISVINWLNEEYRKRDNGLNLLVAVKGAQQKKIFQKANFPVVELGEEFHSDCPPYERLPSYEDDWGLDMDDSHCRLHRATYRCSRRIAYAYARYLQERKEKDAEEELHERSLVLNFQDVNFQEIVLNINDMTLKICIN